MMLTFVIASVLLSPAAKAQNVSQTAMAGPYSVTLKVLPAESFSGPNAAMAWDGGAEPNHLNGPDHPNHHMVAFIKMNGAPVLDADVTIRYRRLPPTKGEWMSLPMARMHMAGMGLKTTHYGNNVKLTSGTFQVQVTVNGKGPAEFHFSM